MQPDHVALALGLWVAMVLMLPKRRWREIPRRLAEVAAGRRRYVFGPPSGAVRSGTKPLIRFADVVRADALRVLEAGVPLFLVELAVEPYGRQRRLERELRWGHTSAGLAWRLMEGELSEEDVSRRLELSGLPPVRRVDPVVNAQAVFVRPPVQWTEEWEAEQAQLAKERTTPEVTVRMVPFRPDGSSPVSVCSLGRLRLRDGDEDLTPGLVRRPVLAFIWLYLLVRSTADPGIATDRATLAQELTPWLDREQQLARLRGRLHDIAEYLDPRLARMVIFDDQSVRLDLTRYSFDVTHLRSLAEEMKSAGPLLSRSLMEEATTLLEESSGEFLPEWDALEAQVAMGKGSSGEMVVQVRQDIERIRVDLLVAIADGYVAWKNPADAVRFLEEAHSRRPDLDPIARRFAEVLRAAGQPSRAKQIEAEYGFSA
jgi:hypothetical protein